MNFYGDHRDFHKSLNSTFPISKYLGRFLRYLFLVNNNMRKLDNRRCHLFFPVSHQEWGAEGYEPRTMVQLLNTALEKASVANLSKGFLKYKITNCHNNHTTSHDICTLFPCYLYSTLCSWMINATIFIIVKHVNQSLPSVHNW